MTDYCFQVAGDRGKLRELAGFRLHFAPDFAINRSGLHQRVNADAILTKSPLWEARWLLLRLNALALKGNTSALSDSAKQKARSLLKLRCISRPTTTTSK